MERNHDAKERAGGETAPNRKKTERDVGRVAVRGAKKEQRARDVGRTATRAGR